MTIVRNFSLFEAMNNGVKQGGKKFAAILIDEQGQQAPPNKQALIDTLAQAKSLRMPIYILEIDSKVNQQAIAPIVLGKNANPLVKTNSNFCIEGATVVKKPHISMFNPKTNLDMKKELQSKNIDAVVIMGQKTNQCVKTNAVGGFTDRQNQNYFAGLNDICKVYTCDDILRDQSEATWKNAKNVFFYTKLKKD
ncbi:isochorismatase family protein [Hahella sp. CCB-MM4]|uniref:isochorismatase family protein n=1 Tax=Hahella sp. (strain CCB-MM4) TaxID=1926491 RepID=UPI000B9A7047|nr:isochorismatase family protein [Hahella sp. CCB-MM4]